MALPQLLVRLSVSLLVLVHLTPAQQQVYKCASGGASRQTLTNFDGYTFQMDLTPPSSSYLSAGMDCGILLIGYSTSRWLITMTSISLGAYQSQFVIQDGGVGGRQIVVVNSSNIAAYRQVVTNGTFYARLTTLTGPSGLATGVKLTIELLGMGDCPSGWFTVPSSSGNCYGVPKLVSNLTYDDATKGCNMLMANLIMGDFDYDSISPKLASAPASMLNTSVAYWVGLYEKESDVNFLNKFSTSDTVFGQLCSTGSSSCNCIAYQNRRFYRDDCNSRRPYICYMPRGGTSSYYTVSDLISTASTVITIVAIVLIVGFIVSVLISLIIVLVCCARRAAEMRRNRRQAAARVTAGYPHPPMASTLSPPPYPTTDAAANAPPVYTVYANGAFDAAGTGVDDKPPAYGTPDWSAERVPA